MSDALAHDGLIIVNVFVVDLPTVAGGKYQNPKFLKRGLMPVGMFQTKPPIFVDCKQYELVDTCYDLGHREVMAFVKYDASAEIVSEAAAAEVPDVARYGASAH